MGVLDKFRRRSPPDARITGPIGPTSVIPLMQAFTEQLASNGYAPAQVERVGTATRCLQLVSQAIATMPLRARASFSPAWVQSPDPAWFPNGIGDALFAATWSMYARGDGFLWVTSRYETGYPATWTVLDPVTMVVGDDPGGGRTYRSNSVDLDPLDVLQITRDPKGELRGTGALEAYYANLSASFHAESYAADIFLGSGIPNAVLRTQRRITKEQAEELQAQWVERVAARLSAPAVIPPDVDFQQLAFSPRDLMLLESREYDGRQIAAAFGVPAFLLNLPQAEGLNYSNPAMLTDMWWRSELMPAAARVERALSTWLPRGGVVEFDPSILLRPDPASNVDMWLKLLQAGVVTRDEVRAATLDLPPLTEGEALEEINEPPGSQSSILTEQPASLEVVQ